MKMVFNIDYETKPGQDLFLCIRDDKYPMTYTGNGHWVLSLESLSDYPIDYKYEVHQDGSTLYEVGDWRHLAIGAKSKCVETFDSWQGMDENAPFLTVPFTEIFSHHKDKGCKTGKYFRETIIRVTVPNTSTEEDVYICGSSKELGCWDETKALKMDYCGGSRWIINLHGGEAFEYKFIRKSAKYPTYTEWEYGENHLFARVSAGDMTVIQEHSCAAFAPRRPRIAGTAIPVFSLRSRKDWGIGDFSDIKLMVDWAAATGQKILQLLPINDTTSTGTWTDSYPYSGISIMALHPIYLDLSSIGRIADREHRSAFEKERKEVNNLPMIDYQRVLKLKTDYSREIFKQEGDKVCNSEDFKTFLERNRDWLLPYAAFCCLRDKNGTADFSKWGEYSDYTGEKVEKLWKSKRYGEEMKYCCFIQYHLDRQLSDARNYAHSKGVALKGDIPIGITPHSVEAWKEPHYFNMDSQAGAPPDFFSADGQNWGFPTYNWDRMAEDGYLWWKRRFSKMAEYFDAYRIDHVLGFFRIWEIPQGHNSGKMGHFAPALPYRKYELIDRGMNLDLFLEDPHKPGYYHPRIDSFGKGGADMDALYRDFFFSRHNEFWKAEARKRLPALIAATGMLTCAEDLGMIPDCVPQVLEQLKILTLEIQRMPKDMNVSLGDPATFPYMCVCTTGSHDTSTLRGWWGENHGGEDASPDVCRWIIGQHLGSPAMLTILPWQDWTSIDYRVRASDTTKERINDPSNPRHYWRYRMHISLEDILSDEAFNAEVRGMVSDSGR